MMPPLVTICSAYLKAAYVDFDFIQHEIETLNYELC
jgi:hypothetical protein